MQGQITRRIQEVEYGVKGMEDEEWEEKGECEWKWKTEEKKTPFAFAEYQEISLLLYFLSRKTIGINLDSLSRAVTGIFPSSCWLIVDRGDIYFVRVFKKSIDFRKIALWRL